MLLNSWSVELDLSALSESLFWVHLWEPAHPSASCWTNALRVPMCQRCRELSVSVHPQRPTGQPLKSRGLVRGASPASPAAPAAAGMVRDSLSVSSPTSCAGQTGVDSQAWKLFYSCLKVHPRPPPPFLRSPFIL